MTILEQYKEGLRDSNTGGTTSDGEQGCSVCAPKLALTPEEESILEKMRAIKQQVRPITERLKTIEHTLGIYQNHPTGTGDTEWAELNDELNRLRTQWKEWEARLEDAIERKLILLGHRQPH